MAATGKLIDEKFESEIRRAIVKVDSIRGEGIKNESRSVTFTPRSVATPDPAQGLVIRRFTVSTHAHDYLTCFPVDRADVPDLTKTTFVALSNELRKTGIDGATVTSSGPSVTYTYTAVGRRSAAFSDSSMGTRVEYIYPFFTGRIIHAVNTFTGLAVSGNAVVWMYLNFDGRGWQALKNIPSP